ncbi:MAG: RNA polymerase sigma factor [Candidatus Zixiibacteriota bacterium]
MTATIPELVDRFINGDHEAFAELVRRYQKKIYSLAFQFLGNHLDADEVVQETFVRVYRRRQELKGIKYFSTFLLKIATNYAIDLLRKRRGHTGIVDEALSLPRNIQIDLSRQVATPGEEVEDKELMVEIRRALDQLPPRQRITAVLHDVEGYSTAEIARVLDCPQATVRSNLFIARSKLKKILKRRLGEGE